MTEAELARLRSPIGLDLGARTPEETAVAIAAELIQLRWGGSGQPLTATTGRIHHPDCQPSAADGSVTTPSLADGPGSNRPRPSARRSPGSLLAAGEGRRLGQPKALVEIGGETLAQRGVALLRDGGATPVVVVTGAVAVDLPGVLDRAQPGLAHRHGLVAARPGWPRCRTAPRRSSSRWSTSR